MASLSNLSDKQNLLLTQLSYHSDTLQEYCDGEKTLNSLLSSNITDDGARKILKELSDAGLGDFKIKAIEHDYTTGFGAVAFTDETGNTGFSFRGTDGLPSSESMNDWLDNLVTAVTGTSVQTAQAEMFFDANRDASGNNYLYGHSKGGELAESVFVNNYSRIEGAHLLNPQPLNPYSLTIDQLIAISSDKVDIVVIEGDYVWFTGNLPSFRNIRIAKSNDGDSHQYASIEDMFDENDMIQLGEQPLWEYAAYAGISTAVDPFQKYGGQVGLVYNSTVRVVDYVKNDLAPLVEEFIVQLVEELKEIYVDMKEFVVELQDFLMSIVDRVKEWYNRHYDFGCKYALANPNIKVDTYKLITYAQKLRSINSRILKLDLAFDGLYRKVGWLDLWELMKADLMTGYSWRLLKAASYLSDTANDFDDIEKELNNKL